MSNSGQAVFLSYASQDAEAAKRICDALRAAGVEVWFDQSELRGGDAWDALIRKRIKECALFVPVISANTQARAEGYFRLEWKLAVDRSHLMADDAAFLFPVVIDDTPDGTARVPDKFRDVQWTRLNVKDTPETLAARVTKLLSGEASSFAKASKDEEDRGGRGGQPHWMRKVGMIGGITIGLIYAIRPLLQSGSHSENKPAVAVPAAPSVPAPAVSEARQLALKARGLLDVIDSTPDDFATAEGLIKRALELDANDGFSWAIASRINSSYLSRGFDSGDVRREAARSQAERAVKLAPDSPEAWLAQGRAAFFYDIAQAETALRQGLQLAPEDGRLLLALGSWYRRQNRLDEAMVAYEQAAARPESRALARYDQYLIHFYLHRFAEADRCLREAIAVVKTTNMIAGLALLEVTWRGRTDEARKVLADAPAAVRNQPRVVLAAALINLMADQPGEALGALDRLTVDYINDAWFAGPKGLLVGLAHAGAGRNEAARLAWETGLVVVQRRLQDTPNNAEVHLRRGELLAWLGRREEALQEIRASNELRRDRSAVDWTDWTSSPARIYAALGDADAALPLLKRLLADKASGRWPLTPSMLRLDPLWSKLRGDPRFQALCVEPLAQKSEDRGQTTENSGPIIQNTGAAPISEGAQLSARALALYTKVGFTRDDLAPAEDFARRATEKEPDSAAAWGIRAVVQSAWLLRGWDTSEKRCEDTQGFAYRALALDPNEPEAILALGAVLRNQGAYDQAIELLRRAGASHPGHLRLLRALGYTLTQSGREPEARVVLLKAVEQAPRDPLLRYELALAYATYVSGGADAGNLASVLEQLDAAIAIQPFSSALILKAALLVGWRGDLAAMRAVLDQLDQLRLSERSEDRSVCIAMWAGLLEHRPDRVENAAALTARSYFDDTVMPYRLKSWSLALAHQLAGKDAVARSDWMAAEAVLRQRLKDEPGNLRYLIELASTLAWLGQRDEATRLAGLVEPLWKEAPTFYSARLLALFYAAMGDAKNSVAYLKGNVDQTVFSSRKVIPLDPWWDKVRGQPEFEALLKEREAVK